MKFFVLTLSCMVLMANGLTYVPSTQQRLKRDVSHLKLNYLPPFETHQLSNEYLPPVSNEIKEEVVQPSNEYLPPISNEIKEEEETQPSNEYLPPVTTTKQEVEIVTEIPEPIKDYLPPIDAKDIKEEVVIIKQEPQPNNEYLPPPAKIEQEVTTTLPQEEPAVKINEEFNIAAEEPEITTVVAPLEETTTETVQTLNEAIQDDTAIFAEDGYHYKQPSEIPAGLFGFEPATLSASQEYLLPLEGDDIIETEGPSDGESAVLAEDGYHYRVIKRRI